MTWLASNWFFILFLAGMVWMHLHHGGHGGHQPGRREDGAETSAAEHGGHREPAALVISPSEDRDRPTGA